MNNNSFIVSNGNEKTIYEILATYHDDETNKDYIVYRDKTLTKDNKLKIYYSLYEKINDGIKLININSKEEEIGLSLIKSIIEDIK